ncbi:MAG: hypothetical protein SGJ27_12655 [Candidatus Melainabacteria bacterium]|nr:hypothetical protein [Candidatus Melainabacteria bacterium]
MLKSKMLYLSALVAVSTISLSSQPAFAQLEPADQSDMQEVEIVLNVPEGGLEFEGPPGFPPPPGEGGEEMSIAFSMLPPPGMTVGAMRAGHGGGSRGGRHHGGGCPLWMLDGENAVTDDQYEKLYDLKNRTLDQIGPKMLELHTASRHLRDALTQETIDEKSAKKLQSQITGLKAEALSRV